MPGKHHLRGFKIAPKKIGSPLRGSWTMVSIALVDARKTSLTGVQNSKKIGSPLRGSWTMVSIALVDARKTSLTCMGVQNSKKIGSPLRGSWTMLRIVVGSNPPPPWKKARSAPVMYQWYIWSTSKSIDSKSSFRTCKFWKYLHSEALARAYWNSSLMLNEYS